MELRNAVEVGTKPELALFNACKGNGHIFTLGDRAGVELAQISVAEASL